MNRNILVSAMALIALVLSSQQAFAVNNTTGSCRSAFGKAAMAGKYECVCKGGYTWNEDHTQCVADGTPKKTTSNDRVQNRVQTRTVNSKKVLSSSSAKSKRSSASSAKSKSTVKLTTSFPINLVTNNEWKIRVTAEEDADINRQMIFELSKTDGQIDVVAYAKDLKTGTLEVQSGYDASFDKMYKTTDEYLEIHYCWYQYEYIREGFSCHFYRIPALVTAATVIGDDSFEFLLTSASDVFTVEILKKSQLESNCSVKGELYEGSKIYYTQSSPFYDESSVFKCFDSESAAKKAGYTKSYR